MNQIFLCMAVLAIGSAHASTADDRVISDADALIAARQASMDFQASLIAEIMRAIGNDAEIRPFERTGEAIASRATGLRALFPAGTERGQNTRALPVIWSDRTGFEQAAANLAQAALTMAKAAAAGNRSEFVKAASATNLACAKCHFTYRFVLN
jgi:cytochrome c556